MPTDGETKQGMDIAYNGVWGDRTWWSLANTQEPLYLSCTATTAPPTKAWSSSTTGPLPVQGGRFRGHLVARRHRFLFDIGARRWDDDRVRFVFGYDGRANLVQKAEGMAEQTYDELVTRAERAIATRPRRRPKNVKDEVVRQRRFKVLRQKVEDVVAFSTVPASAPATTGWSPAQEHLG